MVYWTFHYRKYQLSDSDRSKSKKKKRRSDKSRQKSLSPLSKRMALMSGAGDLADVFGGEGAANDYELRVSLINWIPIFEQRLTFDSLQVNKFLDMTRDDDNYEEKVRKFVEEASKYRKDRKAQEEKSKKKDRKKSKKSKSSKKKKKEKKSKSGKKDKDELDNLELREALKYDFLSFLLIFRFFISSTGWMMLVPCQF